MPTASVAIAEAANSGTARLTFELSLKAPNGDPVAGVEVAVTLEGDGSLQSGFSSKEVKRTTDEDGVERVSWYRRGIYGRPVKATLSVASDRNDVAVALRQVEDESTEGGWISWAPRRRIV